MHIKLPPYSPLPSPKLTIGQAVSQSFVINDELDPLNGKSYQNFGIIAGILWGHPDYRAKGWFYLVWFTDSTLEQKLPNWDFCHEDDLEAYNELL